MLPLNCCKPNEKNELSLSSLFVNNKLRHIIEDQRATSFSEEYSQLDNYGLNFTWTSRLASKVNSQLDLTLSDYRFEYLTNRKEQSGDLVSQTDLVNTLTDFSGRYELDIELKKGPHMQSGAEVKSQQTFFNVRNVIQMGQPVDDDLSQQEDGVSFSPYINYQLRRFKKLNVQLGVRGTYFEKQSDIRVAPRLFAHYNVSDDFTFKGSYGLYNQYLGKIQNLRLFSTGGLDN